MVVALAGLPGTGKSTLARALGRALGAVVLDKDAIRAELFAPERIEYSRAQDDHCCRVMHERAGELLAAGLPAVVFDGRTYSRRDQVEALEAFARSAGAELCLVECVADERVALERLERDAREGRHPAANRGVELYRALAAEREPLVPEHLVVDTSAGTTGEHVARCVAWLASR